MSTVICTEYFDYLDALLKNRGEPVLENPRRVKRICVACNVYLFNAHFSVYHTPNTTNVQLLLVQKKIYNTYIIGIMAEQLRDIYNIE